MKKLLIGIAICFLFASLIMLPYASADTLEVGHSFTYYSGTFSTLSYVHPTSALYLSAVGTTFNVSSTFNLTKASFYMFPDSDGVGNARVRAVVIEAANDSAPTSSMGYLVSSLDCYTSANITTGIQNFTFTSTTLTAGYDYYIGVINEVYSGAFTDGICVGRTTTTYAGSCYTYWNADWSLMSGELVFALYSDTTADPTPTPTPSSSGSGDADIENLTAIILPWLVPLLICLIPALLGYKFVGELGFFIGLNVGCILAYVTLAGTAYAFPLWGIILVGVMDVAVVLMRR